MALGLLALGLDPERSVLFRQSDRPEHVELTWLFAVGHAGQWVERTPSFKEKKRTQPDDVNHALLTYPILQAADIAIYHARYVPVGKDQAAHLELAREIVRAWNARYGAYFVEPQAVFTDSPIVQGTDGVNKMSKSLGNVIEIFADEERPEAGHVHGHRHAAHQAHATRDDPRSATSASCSASSATTTRRSGRASGRRPPAASTRSACWPTGCSSVSPRPASAGPSWRRDRATSRRSCAPAPRGWRRWRARPLREAHERMGLGPVDADGRSSRRPPWADGAALDCGP